VARQLGELGFEAAALKGGYNAWRETYPVEPKERVTTPHTATGSDGGGLDSAADEPDLQPAAPPEDNDV
jgi:hypothetical protein